MHRSFALHFQQCFSRHTHFLQEMHFSIYSCHHHLWHGQTRVIFHTGTLCVMSMCVQTITCEAGRDHTIKLKAVSGADGLTFLSHCSCHVLSLWFSRFLLQFEHRPDTAAILLLVLPMAGLGLHSKVRSVHKRLRKSSRDDLPISQLNSPERSVTHIWLLMCDLSWIRKNES